MFYLMVSLYLGAIVLANLLVNELGSSYAPLIGFCFIGLDLVARDHLHELWHKHLVRNVSILILSGSLLTILLNAQATQIALASCSAFALSAIADTVVYQYLLHNRRLVKINGSNLVSAFVDSLAFPILAFGFPILWGVILGQLVAKILGGALWSWILERLVWSHSTAV